MGVVGWSRIPRRNQKGSINGLILIKGSNLQRDHVSTTLSRSWGTRRSMTALPRPEKPPRTPRVAGVSDRIALSTVLVPAALFSAACVTLIDASRPRTRPRRRGANNHDPNSFSGPGSPEPGRGRALVSSEPWFGDLVINTGGTGKRFDPTADLCSKQWGGGDHLIPAVTG